MKCNCGVIEFILGVVVIVFALWPNWLGAITSQWVMVIAGIILVLHSLICKGSGMCRPMETRSMDRHKPRSRKSARRR